MYSNTICLLWLKHFTALCYCAFLVLLNMNIEVRIKKRYSDFCITCIHVLGTWLEHSIAKIHIIQKISNGFLTFLK